MSLPGRPASSIRSVIFGHIPRNIYPKECPIIGANFPPQCTQRRTSSAYPLRRTIMLIMCVECIAVPHWPSSLPLLSSIQPKIRHTNSLIDFVEKFANERKDMVVVVSYPHIICVTVGLQHPTGRYKCSRRNWNRVVFVTSAVARRVG